MSIIVPAILESDQVKFEEKLNILNTLPKITLVQVDFCDGIFVESHSLNIDAIGHLPKKYQFEAHLMQKSPDNFALYKDKGFKKIIVHYEAFETENLLEEAIEKISSLGLEAAIAISPQTDPSTLRYFADNVKHFTLLGVNPGKQGQSMLPETLHRLAELKEIAPKVEIEVDGGVNENNIDDLSKLGASGLVVGSSLFNGSSVKQNYINLTTKLS